MARNKVQFQKGLSEAQFAVLYGTEDQCREAVMRWRWPSGFVCPVCAGGHHSFVKTRALYQCTPVEKVDAPCNVGVAAGSVVGVGIETADVVVHEVLSRRRRRGKLTPGIFGNL